MSNVTLTIGGRQFVVATAEGEEPHIEELGRLIDAKLAGMGDQPAMSEPRMLLFAALLLADELQEINAQGGGNGGPVLDEKAGEKLDVIASRLENLAERLESRPVNA